MKRLMLDVIPVLMFLTVITSVKMTPDDVFYPHPAMMALFTALGCCYAWADR